ncbi:MAG: response regulator transcription factor [Thermoflavifilum sp.]|nr:response regulator transcription factor [Thermoflavifilum sp.]
MLNEPLRVLVIDDEPDGYAIIEMMLRRQSQWPIASCQYVPDLFQAESLIHHFRPHWLLVDLELTEANGLSIAHILPADVELELSFMTAHDQEKGEVLCFSQMFLLQKPIHREALQRVLQFMQDHLFDQQKHVRLQVLKSNLKQLYDPQYLALPMQQSWVSLSLDQIRYLTTYGDKTEFFLLDNQVIVDRPFSEYQRFLHRHPAFLHIHPAYLIQLTHVEWIDIENLQVHMDDGAILPVTAHKLPILLRTKQG